VWRQKRRNSTTAGEWRCKSEITVTLVGNKAHFGVYFHIHFDFAPVINMCFIISNTEALLIDLYMLVRSSGNF
jgi:hypothetical protein